MSCPSRGAAACSSAAGLAALAGEATPLGAAALAGVISDALGRRQRDRAVVLAQMWLADGGLAFAACAAVELMSLRPSGRSALSGGREPWPVRRLSAGESRPARHAAGSELSIAGKVRAALASAGQDDYDAALAALRPYRSGDVHQRVAASFLAPTETAWHEEDCAAVLAADNPYLAAVLMAAVTDPRHLASLVDQASHTPASPW